MLDHITQCPLETWTDSVPVWHFFEYNTPGATLISSAAVATLSFCVGFLLRSKAKYGNRTASCYAPEIVRKKVVIMSQTNSLKIRQLVNTCSLHLFF
jgi:hypothetical protein